MNIQHSDTIIKEAVAQAEAWQNRANELLTSEEKVIQDQLRRLLIHPTDKAVMTKMIDQSFRSRNESRVALRSEIKSQFKGSESRTVLRGAKMKFLHPSYYIQFKRYF